jgi:predicted ATPase
MFPILAELARDAAEHTQVIFTTHSPEFLDAFSEFAPTVTVSTCEKGQTQFSIVDDRELQRWLKEYRLGELYRSNELQALA